MIRAVVSLLLVAVLCACSGPSAATPGATARATGSLVAQLPTPSPSADASGANAEPTATAPTDPTADPTVAVESPATGGPSTSASPFMLMSPAFSDGQPTPTEHTCDGADAQLPVHWTGTPDGSAELALVMHDPDAGGFVHWVVVGIPPDATGLGDPLPDGARHGRNDFGRARYDGPCPPSGVHTYVTRLYALSAPLDLGEEPTARAVRQAAEGQTLAVAELRGTYRRTR